MYLLSYLGKQGEIVLDTLVSSSLLHKFAGRGIFNLNFGLQSLELAPNLGCLVCLVLLVFLVTW